MPATVNIPETDPATNPHWHLTTAQATDHFDTTHANQPAETWTAADFDTHQNLRLAT